MIVIDKPIESLINAIGGYADFDKNKKYRDPIFVIKTDMGGGSFALYNDVTKASVYFNKDEKIDDKNLEYLVKCYYKVPEDFDDLAFAKKVRDAFIPKNNSGISDIVTYTILPTTDCNARCFYCYEKDIKKEHMTMETADKIVDYICENSKPNVGIKLRWFGGEPLYNADIIDHICLSLTARGINFISDIVTNGYLFGGELVYKAKNNWALNHAQITLDGTEEVYNKAKNYIYKDNNSPYQKVMESIETLLENGIHVSIRMNVDLYNQEDIKKLIPILHERFSKYKGFSMGIHELFESAMKKRKNVDERTKLYEKLHEIDKILEDYGYVTANIDRSFKPSMCIADNGHSILFTPSGRIGLCEHYTDSEFIGDIDLEGFDQNMILKWREVDENNHPYCKTCPFTATCFRLKNCIEESNCHALMRDRKIWRFQMNHKRYVMMKLKNYGQMSIPVPFTVIREGNYLHFLLTKTDFGQFIKDTNDSSKLTDEFIVFLSNSNLGRYRINRYDIGFRTHTYVVGQKLIGQFIVNITNYPGIKNEKMFEWGNIKMFGNKMETGNGRVTIADW